MQLESGMFSSLIKRFYSPFCSSIRSSIIGIAYDFIRLILNKANEWIALIYTSSSPREIYKDTMRCDDVSDSKCKIHSHTYVVSFGALITELMKRNQLKMLLHMIESKAHSVCVCAKCRYIFAKWMLFTTEEKKNLLNLVDMIRVYIYTKTELICHPNRRHTFAKLIKNRMKFKMQFTWLHLFLLLNSEFFFFLIIFHERTCIVRIFNVLPTCNCHFQLSFLQISTTNMPNSSL